MEYFVFVVEDWDQESAGRNDTWEYDDVRGVLPLCVLKDESSQW